MYYPSISWALKGCKDLMNNKKLESTLLSERSQFILIGLTGRTGSGCTTTASLLSDNDLKFPKASEVSFGENAYFSSMDAKRYNVVSSYADKHSNAFRVIKLSDVIGAALLCLDKEKTMGFIRFSIDESYHEYVERALAEAGYADLKETYNSLNKECDYFLKNDGADTELNADAWLANAGKFAGNLKKAAAEMLGNSYVNIFQGAGDSIRRTTAIVAHYNSVDFNPKGLFELPRIVNRLIKHYRREDKAQGKETYVVIDAIRNPYEAKYFKDRYAAFNLISINAPDEDRKRYLQNKHNYTIKQIDEMDSRESGDSSLSIKRHNSSCSQCGSKASNENEKYNELVLSNVKKCIEISDIHFYNPRNESQNVNVLKAQIAWYLSLMKHPGLVTPTALERVMQIAFTAKMNSGCISRQVGAVVTDQSYSIKSIGWNDVAKGQTPCNLRSLRYLDNFSSDTVYSDYERSNESFRSVAREQLIKVEHLESEGRNLAYCFKSLQHEVDGNKNQVHTRSLHAEENAFLQLSKYGGMGIEGGKLFTTASPCELCAKKAYQLGVKEIIYIDPYPGIAIQHVISIGDNPPSLVQFRGAVGNAYFRLYEPIMPYKDEIEYLS
ncbi:anti-phage dCTP deaminase [Cobetia amphilecti]|uniref:Anti-phage dCTP deaminase n=1 Tax=Cobetia amphilecti TaxID=1055104 RepID=A0AAP4WXY0_9GAMM|nr:anti-phage dCTP deaminase [Cobetia amphilecti]MDO6671574.1 anti-phage dCTP deaminase [Cobetia amphilecti]